MAGVLLVQITKVSHFTSSSSSSPSSQDTLLTPVTTYTARAPGCEMRNSIVVTLPFPVQFSQTDFILFNNIYYEGYGSPLLPFKTVKV